MKITIEHEITAERICDMFVGAFEGFSPNWKPIKQKLKGLAAICAQHEVDHLFGFDWEKIKETER